MRRHINVDTTQTKNLIFKKMTPVLKWENIIAMWIKSIHYMKKIPRNDMPTCNICGFLSSLQLVVAEANVYNFSDFSQVVKYRWILYMASLWEHKSLKVAWERLGLC